MALVKCKECDEEISSKATKCPKCGIEIKKTSTFTWIVCAILLFWFIGKIGSFGNSVTGTGTNTIDHKSLAEITATDLVRAYEANTVSADQEYKDKYFKVTGEIVSINTDFKGDPYLVMKGTRNEFSNPQFKFSKEHSSEIAALFKGLTATLVCKGAGDIAKSPMSDSCVVVKTNIKELEEKYLK
ncbi:MAG: hypothetical protein V1782_09870 [Pseudomonadota bacterium]